MSAWPLSYPVPAEPWLGPPWLYRSPALCTPRWLRSCPTGGHIWFPTSLPSAPPHDPRRVEARPSGAPWAARKDKKKQTKKTKTSETIRLVLNAGISPHKMFVLWLVNKWSPWKWEVRKNDRGLYFNSCILVVNIKERVVEDVKLGGNIQKMLTRESSCQDVMEQCSQ